MGGESRKDTLLFTNERHGKTSYFNVYLYQKRCVCFFFYCNVVKDTDQKENTLLQK